MKIVKLLLLLITTTSINANEFSIEHIINLEQRLNTLKSEIFITQKSTIENSSSAIYHIKNKSWAEGFKSLSTNNATSSIEIDSVNNILYGISLQGQNKNREALKYYNKVPYNSVHYATSQLNIALLHMKDGHTNKAVIKINKLLTDSSVILTEEVKDKILLTQGYIYLKNNKYQESRESFRKINIKSTDSNRASIGIALAANQLNDHIASQNILSFLQQQNEYDLATDESYLLLAFTLESQKKYSEAIKAYEDAIKYYRKRLNNINTMLYLNEPLIINKVINKHVFVVSANKIDLLENLPYTFFNNYALSKQLLKNIENRVGTSNKMYARANELISEYNKIINPLLFNQLVKRQTILMDYLNQSRYGLVLSKDLSYSLKKQ